MSQPDLPKMSSRRALASVLLALLLAQALGCRDKSAFAGLVDLEGNPATPFEETAGPTARPSGERAPASARRTGAKAFVYLFLSVDCPISNRYAPEVGRLHSRFAPRQVVFRIVYPGSGTSAEEIRRHLREFNYPCEAFCDLKLSLARRAGVRVTPEAAVFLPDGRLVYHGRIDDRFPALNAERPAAVQHDLEQALNELLEGKPVSQPHAPAIGCYISGL
jgi:hypothetical protein